MTGANRQRWRLAAEARLRRAHLHEDGWHDVCLHARLAEDPSR